MLRLKRALTLLSLALSLLVPSATATPANPPKTASQQTQHSRRGAVATGAKECSRAGIEMLERGGNAADAQVAATFCAGVVAMYHSGIGGGGFALIRGPDGKFEVVDFRETAPAAATEDMFKDDFLGSLLGGEASGVPGEVRGLEYIHKKYGKLPWKRVMQPAINLAREGFEVSEDLAHFMKFQTDLVGSDFLVTDKSFAKDFAPKGKLLRIGEKMHRHRLANTLEEISEQGAKAFYQGRIGNATIRAIKKDGGIMTKKDLKDYKIVTRPAVHTSFDNGKFRLTSTGAPSSGAVCLSILKTMDGYGRRAGQNVTTHRLNEAMRWAYAQRTQLGDPAFVPGLQDFQETMLSEAAAAKIRRKITRNTHNVKYYNPRGFESVATHGTAEIATADASGMAISLTTTVNLLFGSMLMVPETGVIMNNEMNDFSTPNSSNAFGFIPTPRNFIRPGKRPLSSISPVIVTKGDGSLHFVTGGAGGSRIITAVAQTLWQGLGRGAGPYEAIKHPRIHDQLSPNKVSAEDTFDDGAVAFLRERGAKVERETPGLSIVHAIRRKPNGEFEAAAEPRLKNAAGLVV